MTTTAQDTKISTPRTDGYRILMSHYAGELMQWVRS